MNITSDIKFVDVSYSIPEKVYTDNYNVIYEKDYTEHLIPCITRYSPVTYVYRNDNIIGISVRHYGEYSELELALLRNFMHCDSTIVYDIGANIGIHTQGFSKTSKHVYAFEPNSVNYKLLGINTFNNKNVSIYNCAISDTNGTITVEKLDLNDVDNYGEVCVSDSGETVDCYTIDSLVKSNKIQSPHVIKIDVEGHELNVFKGMIDTIKNNLPVILYEAMHCDLKGIYDILNMFGYNLFYFPVPNYNNDNFYKNKTNIFGMGGVLNILAVPFHIDIKTNLPKVLSRDDTYELAIRRMQDAQN